MRLRREIRSGTTLVESAVVYPFVILMLFGLIIGGLGIFRYQEMSALARRAARYASVRGQQWATDTGHTAVSSTDIYNNAILPSAGVFSTWRFRRSVRNTASILPIIRRRLSIETGC